jgi:hypothetical protein
VKCPKVARLRHAAFHPECPLLGQDRKWLAEGQSVAIDPTRTWAKLIGLTGLRLQPVSIPAKP